ncbi:MAG: hypothetical protein EGMGGAKC_00572 [Dehalococcoides mccartyi]|nr:hypothetical protein [Dehalococcoides mccartyi]
MARLWELVTASISPVSPRVKGESGRHWERPPPAAEPFILKVGPLEGWRIAPVTFLPRLPSPCTSPIVVVLLPSPSGVGVMAVTSIYLPFGLSFRRVSTPAKSTLATYLPWGIISSSVRPSSSASIFDGFRKSSAFSAISQSFIRPGSRSFKWDLRLFIVKILPVKSLKGTEPSISDSPFFAMI